MESKENLSHNLKEKLAVYEINNADIVVRTIMERIEWETFEDHHKSPAGEFCLKSPQLCPLPCQSNVSNLQISINFPGILVTICHSQQPAFALFFFKKMQSVFIKL